MGLPEECDRLQSILRQALDMLAEAQSCASALLDYDYYELDREISHIIGINYEVMIRLQTSLNQIEMIQAMIGTQNGGYDRVSAKIKSLFDTAIKSGFLSETVSSSQVNNVCNDPEKSDRPSSEAISGETHSTKLGKEVHAERAAQRRASGQYDLVNEAIPDKEGNPIFVPKEIDMKTGKPKPDTPLQKAVPDAVNFKQALIIDDKPLDRNIKRDRQEIIRFINAYKEREGVMPQIIEIHRYDKNGQTAKIESYKPEDFLPKTMLGGTENVDGT
jgi:hypothetical protein